MCSWALRAKYVDNLSNVEILPRNSPFLLQHLVTDIQSFAASNQMCLNTSKCKEFNVLQYNSHINQPFANRGIYIESVKSLKVLRNYSSRELSFATHLKSQL